METIINIEKDTKNELNKKYSQKMSNKLWNLISETYLNNSIGKQIEIKKQSLKLSIKEKTSLTNKYINIDDPKLLKFGNDDILKLKLEQLKTILKKNGFKISGNKNILIERIRNIQNQNKTDDTKVDDDVDNNIKVDNIDNDDDINKNLTIDKIFNLEINKLKELAQKNSIISYINIDNLRIKLIQFMWDKLSSEDEISMIYKNNFKNQVSDKVSNKDSNCNSEGNSEGNNNGDNNCAIKLNLSKIKYNNILIEKIFGIDRNCSIWLQQYSKEIIKNINFDELIHNKDKFNKIDSLFLTKVSYIGFCNYDTNFVLAIDYTYNMSSKDKTNGCIVCEIEIQSNYKEITSIKIKETITDFDRKCQSSFWNVNEDSISYSELKTCYKYLFDIYSF